MEALEDALVNDEDEVDLARTFRLVNLRQYVTDEALETRQLTAVLLLCALQRRQFARSADRNLQEIELIAAYK